MKSQNQFRLWHRKATNLMTRQQRVLFNTILASKLQKTPVVIGNWLRGTTEPTKLEKVAINVILKSKIYTL